MRRKKILLFILLLLALAGAAALWCGGGETLRGAAGWIRPDDTAAQAPAADGRLRVFRLTLGLAAFLGAAAGLGRLCLGQVRWERFFPAAALGFGLLYLLVITPLSAPDEQTHYETAYRLSDTLLRRQEGEAQDFDYRGFENHYNRAGAYTRLLDEWGKPAGNGGAVTVPVSPAMTCRYLGQYLPQAAGIALADALGWNMLGKFYGGRLANLLFYTVCLYLAIRAIPWYKLLLGLVGTLPITLQQAASFSPDGCVNGLSFLLLALLVRAAAAPEAMSRREYLRIAGCACLLAPAKAGYFTLILLFLAIPRERFGSRERKLAAFLIIAAAGAALIGAVYLPALREGLSAGAALWGRDIYDPRFLLEHPLQTAAIVLRTIADKGGLWLAEAFGGRLSGLTLSLSLWMPAGFALVTALAAQGERGARLGTDARLRVLAAGTAALTALLIVLALFLSWTQKGSPLVQGVQGRYFLPILPLLGMSISSRRLALPPGGERLTAGAALCLCVCPILAVLDYTL